MSDEKVLRSCMSLVTQLSPAFVLGCEFKVIGGSIEVEKDFVKAARCRISFVVPREQGNSGGALFGGSVSAITDILTTGLLFASEAKAKKQVSFTVSTVLNVDFIAAARIGDEVIIDLNVDKFGKTLAFTSADFYSMKAGQPDKVLYRARHQKAIQNMRLHRSVLPKTIQHHWDAIFPVSRL
mmetsp:Transcript_23464/g.33123  ORF Transcript_23464/g.33123 Transcript_23464/m.33123 type:complete len:182 (-) Transcript_23464:38-583(-)